MKLPPEFLEMALQERRDARAAALAFVEVCKRGDTAAPAGC